MRYEERGRCGVYMWWRLCRGVRGKFKVGYASGVGAQYRVLGCSNLGVDMVITVCNG